MSDKRTCLYDQHVALGAKMVSFGGFEMPLQYTDIVSEHQAVRQHCGVFDVSHMGEVLVSGPDAERFVQYIFTNDVSGAPVGKIFYGMMLHETGGTIDDLLVYKMADDVFFLVINAANIDKDYTWIEKQAAAFDVTVVNQSDNYGQLAVQGPESERVVEEVLGLPCSDLAFYTFKTVEWNGEVLVLSRTGYTGEDGFEIYGSPAYTQQAWQKLMDSSRAVPCGLGCRDTLRFEVGLPLYGHELGRDISPLEAGLGVFVKLDKPEFIGKDATLALKAAGLKRKLVGIELIDKAIPRAGYPVEADGKQIGEVTTGYHSISTDKSVCLAFVGLPYASLGTEVGIRIRKKVFPGTVCRKRFYDKKYKK